MRFARVLLNIVLLTSIVFGCSTSHDRQVSATIDGEPIFIESVDSVIYGELYDRLFDIYYSRTVALENVIAKKVLMNEAVDRNISVDSLFKLEIENKATKSALDQMIVENNLTEGVRDPNNFHRVIDVNSAEGQEYLYGVLKRKLERDLVARLKVKHKAEVLLKPPLPPKINTAEIVKYPLNKPVTDGISIIIVSDFNCGSCVKEYPVLKELISSYEGAASLYYAPLSTLVTRDMIFFDCATREKKNYREAFMKMFEMQKDSLDLNQVAKELQVDYTQIQACMEQDKERVTETLVPSYAVLAKNQINLTPSIIIDGRVYYGAMDIESIRTYIDALQKD